VAEVAGRLKKSRNLDFFREEQLFLQDAKLVLCKTHHLMAPGMDEGGQKG
jgi:hypothetical protein